MSSLMSNPYTESYCMSATLSPWVELISPTLRSFSQYPMTILSCHDVHQEEPNSTSIGGYPSYFPTQLVPSLDLVPSLTLMPSQTQAQELVSLLSSETDGVHGNSFLAGSPPSTISNGPKEWVLNFLSEQSQCKVCTPIVFMQHCIKNRACKGADDSTHHVKLHGGSKSIVESWWNG